MHCPCTASPTRSSAAVGTARTASRSLPVLNRSEVNTDIGTPRPSARVCATPAKVATAAGFYDQSHLTRHFSRMLGTSPGRFGRAGDGRPPGVTRA